MNYGEVYIYKPTQSMDQRTGGPGFFDTDGDIHLAGSKIRIDEPSSKRKMFRGVFISGPIAGSQGIFHIDCIAPDKKVVKNKPYRG